MKTENEDEKRPDDNDDAVNPVAPRSTRRQFLKGLTTGTVAIGALTQSGCAPAIPPLKTRGATETTTVCPFCGVGCGQVVATREGKVINIEGDPAHPISEGTLCSKGASGDPGGEQLAALAEGSLPRAGRRRRGRKKAGTGRWSGSPRESKKPATKRSRQSVEGRVVNRTEAIACLGGSALDNEEAYLLVKLMRALGLVYVEHQARL